MANSKTDYQDFKSYLENTLKAKPFNGLSEFVFGSKKRMTWVFKYPGKVKYEELVELDKIEGIDAKGLVVKTGAGADTLTYNELRSLGFKIE